MIDMTRSVRVPIIKVKCNTAWYKSYKRTIRRRIKNVVKDIKNLSDMDSYELPSPKIIVNDWNILDYKIDYRRKEYSKLERKKYSRK